MTVPTLNECMNPSTCAGVMDSSGKVTLKYAAVALDSNGPGVSIEAKVVARMKGGVSSTVGRTSEGIVTMWCE